MRDAKNPKNPKSPKNPKTKHTLDDGDVSVSPRRVGRRRALFAVGSGLAGATALVTGCGGSQRGAAGRAGTGVTDGDSGQCADPVNGGTSNSGLTDSDSGPCADTAGNGRRGG
jgi:hypothetical protein